MSFNQGFRLYLFCLFIFLTLSRADSEEKSVLSREVRARCVEVLTQGLKSQEFWPAMHAAEALTLGGYREIVIKSLSPKLPKETDDQRRCGLARELVRAGLVEKSDIMLEILEGEDRHGHVHAAESLYKVGFRGDDAPLKQAFRETDDIRLKLMAAAALAKHSEGITRSDAFDFLRETLRTERDPAVFRLSAWVLGRIGGESDKALIRSRLDDARPEPLVRAFLEHALAALGDPSARIALMQNLQSEDPLIRTYAAVFAGECGMTEAVPVLVKQLESKHLDERIRAAQALLVLSR